MTIFLPELIRGNLFMTHVIAMLNQKGGVGKTTITVNLARAFQRTGLRVLIVDSDPQGSAQDWSQITQEQNRDMPVVVGVDRPILEKSIPQLRAAFDIIIIDGAAKLQDMTVSALKVADLVLIPVQPSALDIWATSDLVELVKARQVVTEGKPKAAFVVSRQITGTRLANDANEALGQFELPVLNGRTTQRVVYTECIGSGSTVLDLEPEGSASAEITAIMEELQALMRASLEGHTYG
jgi:chromosome partitioning protein